MLNKHFFSYNCQTRVLSHGIRVNLDSRNKKLSYKMRESQTKKIPLTLVIGDKEKNNKEISYRKFGSQETTTISTLEFVKLIDECIENKKSNI